MGVVPSFDKRIAKYLEAPGGKVTTYTEADLETRAGISGIPEGMVVVQPDSKKWVLLVKVKTAKNTLDKEGPIAESFGDSAALTVTIKAPGAAAPVDMTANPATRQVTTSAKVSAPKRGPRLKKPEPEKSPSLATDEGDDVSGHSMGNVSTQTPKVDEAVLSTPWIDS